MTYEKVRRGNPLNITVRQHFHTAHSIAKFYNSNNKVEVQYTSIKNINELNKRASVFCAKRVWDQRAEKGYMSEIELKYHDQIDNIKPCDKRDHLAISRYLALWRLRHKFHIKRQPNAPLYGVDGCENLTKEDQETLESMGVGYINELGELPSRQLTGGQIQIGVFQIMNELKYIKWGLLKSESSHFLSADCYHSLLFIPISPTMAFAGNLADKTLNDREVAIANYYSVKCAKKFYFSDDLSKCPIATN